MKTHLLSISLVFVCVISIAQKREIEDTIYDNPNVKSNSNMIYNFYIENNGVIYKNVYEVAGLSESQITEKLNLLLSTSTGLTNLKYSNNEFTGRIENLTIDYRKFGGKLFTAWTALNSPMFGNLKVQVKESKYRIIISEIELIEPSPYLIYNLSSSSTTDNRTRFTNKKPILQGLEFIDKSMIEKFQLISETTNDNW